MATNIYGATAINDGAAGSMDYLLQSTLADGDICFVIDSNEDFLVFRYESSSSTAESTPWTTNKVVEPRYTGSLDSGRWILADVAVDDLNVYGTYSPSSLTLTGDLTMGDGTKISWDDIAPASDHVIVGMSSQYTAGENLVFGNVCYLKSDGKMWKADADADTTMPVIAMAAATINADAAGDFLEWGWARDDTWAWTVGGLIYASTTSGGLTQTQVSGNGDIHQIVGQATHADRMKFMPDLTYVEITV